MSESSANEILQSVWSEWSVTGFLGSGTYGNVYRAVRSSDSLRGDTTVFSESAVKIISIPRDSRELAASGGNPSYIQQSRREYESIAADFSSEIALLETLKGAFNVVHIEDYKIIRNQDGIGWTIIIRMELLKPIRELYPLNEEETVKLGIDICSALEVCSGKNIIHRDIKPSNIFCTEFGNYKLGDFGIARIMKAADSTMTQGMGTPNFVAPEVMNGEHYDFRSDIYSLGMVLYHQMNNQTPPFCPLDKQILNYQDRMDAYLRRIKGEELPRPVSATDRMSEIILKACAFNPDDRYKSAAEMKSELIALRDNLPPPPEKKRRIPQIALTAVLSALLIGCVGYIAYTISEPRSTNVQDSILTVDNEEDTTTSNDTESETEDAETLSDAVYNSKIVNLSVGSYPVRTSYSDGDAPDLTGLTLIAEYEDGTTRVIDSGYSCTQNILSGEGMQNLTVEYEGNQVYVNVFVKEQFEYRLNPDGKSYALTKMLDYEASETTVPAMHNGLPVTVIASFAFAKCEIAELIIPEGIERIEYCAFNHCSKLKLIVLPKSLRDIRAYSMDETVMGSPFSACSALESIEVHPDNPVYHSDNNCIIETAAKKLVFGCMSSTIPDDGSVEVIGPYAFDEIYNLKEVIIPSGITTIKKNAFVLSGIQKLTISETVTTIEKYAFDMCKNLVKINVDPDNPTYHSDGNCLIETETKKIVKGCKTSVIPSDGSVSEIGERAFYYCTNTDTVTIPEGIISIHKNAFRHSDIRYINIPSTVKNIDSSAFSTCEKLIEITVDKKNTVYHSAGNCIIETYAKRLILGCKGCVIPDDGSVAVIGEDAFGSDKTLTELVIPEGVEKIEADAFANSSIVSLYIPSTINSIHESTFNDCDSLKTITVSPNNPKYHSAGNCIIETDTKKLIVGCISSIIPDDGSVTTIYVHAFYATGITNLTIPESVTVIHQSSLAFTRLKTVRIPSQVTTLYDYAFKGCKYLESIYLPKSLKEIRASAFNECTALKTVYYSGSKEDWNKIFIADGNAYLLNAEIVFDYDD